MDLLSLISDPAAWLALLTLIVLEVVLGIDNLIFIAILSNKLPKEQQALARRIGLALALVMRIALLLLIGWIVTLRMPLFDLGLQGAPGPYGEPTFETAFSGRDLILLVGGLFLLWKATKEIHHNMDPEGDSGEMLDKDKGLAKIGFAAAIAQIIALDLVFSVDSILTAVGMTDEVPNPGAVEFQRDGKTYRLEALDEGGDELFLIYADRTSGHGSYGAGRYLYAAKPDAGGNVVLDFNQGYNPPCAFTAFATCPLPPPENRLDLAIAAGEKAYAKPAH